MWQWWWCCLGNVLDLVKGNQFGHVFNLDLKGQIYVVHISHMYGKSITRFLVYRWVLEILWLTVLTESVHLALWCEYVMWCIQGLGKEKRRNELDKSSFWLQIYKVHSLSTPNQARSSSCGAKPLLCVAEDGNGSQIFPTGLVHVAQIWIWLKIANTFACGLMYFKDSNYSQFKKIVIKCKRKDWTICLVPK